MNRFQIGDVVEINGRQDGVEFVGEVGVVCRQDPYSWGRVGVNFDGCSMRSNRFHSLDGLLRTSTGFYVKEAYLTLVRKKEKTGFSQFITRVESC